MAAACGHGPGLGFPGVGRHVGVIVLSSGRGRQVFAFFFKKRVAIDRLLHFLGEIQRRQLKQAHCVLKAGGDGLGLAALDAHVQCGGHAISWGR